MEGNRDSERYREGESTASSFYAWDPGEGPKRATGQRLTSGSFQVNAVREAKSLAECDK